MVEHDAQSSHKGPNITESGATTSNGMNGLTQLRAELDMDTNTSSSTLSDAPLDDDDDDDDIDENEADLNNDPESSDLSSEPDFSNHHDDPNDTKPVPKSSRKTPLSRMRVVDLERELNLNSDQRLRLHDLMRDELVAAHLLGAMQFTPRNKAKNDVALAPIIARARAELEFLAAATVSEERLDELLLVRIMIINSNERHNRWMLKTGKVNKRADGTVYVPESVEEQAAVEEKLQQQQSVHEPDESVAHHMENEARPSTVVTWLAGQDNMDAAPAAAQDDTPPPSPMQIDEPEPVRAILPPTTLTSTFHPTAFIVRVAHSPTGAAVHTLQLITQAGQHKQISVDDLNFETFLALVSVQVGFDVRGRISAVVPKFHSIAPIDSLVEVGSGATWKAVLQAWQNMRRKTCEFVVEGGVPKV